MSDLEKKILSEKIAVFPPGIEPRTLSVFGERDNHYLTETLRATIDVSSRFFFSVISEVNLVENTNKR